MIKKLEQIRDAVSKYYEIDITDKSRVVNYVKARCNYYFIVKKLLPHATSSMTGMVVNRDHATVLHGRKTHESLFISDNDYAKTSLDLLHSLEHLKVNENYILSNNFRDVININIKLKKEITELKKQIQELEKKNTNEDKTNPFIDIYNYSDDVINEFIENRYKPFMRMNKLKVAN